MSDKMAPVSFHQLVDWMLAEFAGHKRIFGIPFSKFYRAGDKSENKLFGEGLDTPLGPAAGPHTQLCQNIVSAYLTGGRFFELKTVQKLDNLLIDKPCIDAKDEGYNVEWSQELSLEESYSEYIKGWILIHFLKELFGLSNAERGFIFNMSVGYDLDGIMTERMDRFIEELKNAEKNSLFNSYKNYLINQLQATDPGLMEDSFSVSKNRLHEITRKMENISPLISGSVTLSTMHGCPPGEIEAIAKYLIKEKNLHTYVKLNPTLLGYDFVRSTLHGLGYKYVELDSTSFDHDIQYKDAVPMLNRLRAFASAHNRVFGIKLSNTLGVKNTINALPGSDMYMSGRALFPLTVNLAGKIASEFNGDINISFSGGSNQENIQKLLQTGIFPVTFATDLLKPGGYLRLAGLAEIARDSQFAVKRGDKINIAALKSLAEDSLTDPNYNKGIREIDSIKIQKSLPAFDCFIAPCQEACPIHQDVASYIKLVEQQKYNEAFELIVSKNPLPHITGYICDHQCMYHCTRWDYDSPVLIRDLKKEAAENGYRGYLTKFKSDFKKVNNGIRTAVIGAGPSGLSAAYFLAKAGFDVTIFEKEKNAGGIVRNVLPKFRIPEEAIEKDIRFIEMHGIRFVYGIDPGFSIEKLKGEGFKYIYVAIGAGEANQISLEGNSENIFDAIEFLKSFQKKDAINPGRTVAVIGGGNSAMDSARAAKRCAGVEKVYIIYRRTVEQMPADKEEFNSAVKEGAEFKELLLPVKFEDGILTCQKMELVNNDSGRRKNVIPLEDAFIELRVDTLISAIGEHVDAKILTGNNLEMIKNKVMVSELNETNRENVFIGGDALRGPSTVIESIADGRTAAEAIIQKENLPRLQEPELRFLHTSEVAINLYSERRGKLSFPLDNNLIKEAGRCLGCNINCNKCVEVCPNRANVMIETGSSEFKDSNQILHMDALCNECGNCTTFCPYRGDPYKDKVTLFWGEKEFNESTNNGFFFLRSENESRAELRWEGKNGTVRFDKNGDTVKSSTPGYYGPDELIKMMKIVLNNYRYLLPC